VRWIYDGPLTPPLRPPGRGASASLDAQQQEAFSAFVDKRDALRLSLPAPSVVFAGLALGLI